MNEDNNLFNGRQFKNYSNINNYETSIKEKNIIFKCINMKKD